MPNYLDENGNPVQASASTSSAPAKVYLDPNTGEPQHDFSSLTANPKGEGTYQVQTSDGQTVAVPYSNVPVFTQGLRGSSFASPDEEARFQKDAAADPKRPTFWNALTNPVGGGGQKQGIVGGALQVGGQAVSAMAQPFMHPGQAIQGAAQVAADVGNPYALGLDVATPAVQKYMADKAAGGHALALENLGGQAVGATEGGRMLSGAGSGAAGATSDAVQSVRSYLRPASSPAIVARSEMAARNLSAAVLPATKDASNFIRAAQEEVPNVIDYAKRTGNPLNTQLEFSKAAQSYAKDVRSLYNDKILGPVENQSVKTTGTGFGSRTGEGPDTYATLGDIDQRVTAINKQLDAPALNADDARRALASKQELQAEASKLRGILHENLAKSSGLTPDEVAQIRQRVGRSYELAHDTDAAVTQRQQAAGKTDMGPIKMTQLPSRALEFARGGPVPIADRAFQRAIANFPGQASPLPEVKPPAAVPQASLDSLLKSARQKRFNDLTSIDNLLRLQRMQQ